MTNQCPNDPMTKLRHSSFVIQWSLVLGLVPLVPAIILLLALCFAAIRLRRAQNANPPFALGGIRAARRRHLGRPRNGYAQPWHTYWRNGGDAGEATEIKWTLPEGVTAGEINWPLPDKEIDTAGDTSLVTYIYTNEVVLLVPLALDKSLRAGPLKLAVSAKWMECSDICVIAGNDATAMLAIGDAAKPSRDATAIENWREKFRGRTPPPPPRLFGKAPRQRTNARGLIIEWKTNAAPADFYPLLQCELRSGGNDGITVRPGRGQFALHKIVKKSEGDWPKQIDGVLAGRTSSADRFGQEEHLAIQPRRRRGPEGGSTGANRLHRWPCCFSPLWAG